MSGGIDSSTLLYYLVYESYDVYPITFDYGQRHKKELLSALSITDDAHTHFAQIGTPIKNHHVIDISNIQQLLKSALTSDIDVPEVDETAEHYDTLKTTVVPNRNMIFLSIAAGYANSIGAHKVAYAAHFSDRGVYPDCRHEFVGDLETALQTSLDDKEFEVLAPFIEATKADIVRIATQLSVPLWMTWTCYKGEQKHCGVCSSCRERKKAFEIAKIEDPTAYAQ